MLSYCGLAPIVNAQTRVQPHHQPLPAPPSPGGSLRLLDSSPWSGSTLGGPLPNHALLASLETLNEHHHHTSPLPRYPHNPPNPYRYPPLGDPPAAAASAAVDGARLFPFSCRGQLTNETELGEGSSFSRSNPNVIPKPPWPPARGNQSPSTAYYLSSTGTTFTPAFTPTYSNTRPISHFSPPV